MGYFRNLFNSVVNGLVPASGGGTSNFLRADGSWAIPPGIGMTSTTVTLTQTDHGFSAGQVLYYDGADYELNQANVVVPHITAGVVSSITDADHFVLTLNGLITTLSGLTPGIMYYLSDITPGALINSPPTNSSSVTIPVLLAISTTSGIINLAHDYAPIDNPKLQGNVTIVGVGSPTTLSNMKFNAFDTVNDFIQNNIQNLSNGDTASSDWIATADTGTDSTHFIDFGINGSGFSSPDWTINDGLDGYLYIAGGNLAVGTDTPGKNLVLFTGGLLAENARLTLSDTAIVPNVPIEIPASQGLQVADGIPVSTTNTMYADNGHLFFNGVNLATSNFDGGGVTQPPGVLNIDMGGI